jgi:hypothetical protein
VRRAEFINVFPEEILAQVFEKLATLLPGIT